jgi:hypothetical protein
LPSSAIHLTKATKLKSITIVHYTNPRWVAKTLRAIARSHKDLQRISLHAPFLLDAPEFNPAKPANFRHVMGEAAYAGWLELDRLLIQLWESCSIHPEVHYSTPQSVSEENAIGCMKSLFPEATARGSIRLIGS